MYVPDDATHRPNVAEIEKLMHQLLDPSIKVTLVPLDVFEILDEELLFASARKEEFKQWVFAQTPVELIENQGLLLDVKRADAERSHAVVDDPLVGFEDPAARCDDGAGDHVAGEAAFHGYVLSDAKPKSSRRFASEYMSFESRTTAISETVPRFAEATRHGPDLCV